MSRQIKQPVSSLEEHIRLFRRVALVFLVVTALAVLLLILNLKGYSPDGPHIDHTTLLFQLTGLGISACVVIGSFITVRADHRKLRQKEREKRNKNAL